MLYKVIKNGEMVTVTTSYKTAAEEYERAIFNADDHLIIQLYCKKSGSDEWVLARKDWL